MSCLTLMKPNEALRGVKTMLDGNTYRGGKLLRFSSIIFFANENGAGYNWDERCHLQGEGASLIKMTKKGSYSNFLSGSFSISSLMKVFALFIMSW